MPTINTTFRTSLFLILCLVSLGLYASDNIEGHWSGKINLPNQALAFDIDFKKEADGITGDISIPHKALKIYL